MAKYITSVGKGADVSGTEDASNISTSAGKNQAITATTHTIAVSDQSETIEYSNASAIAVTLPDISTVSGSNIHTDDYSVTLKNIGVGVVTATCSGTDTFEDGATSKSLKQYESITIQTDNSLTKWNIIGNKPLSELLNIVYPIGAIYISTANTSPQALFGGTWTAMQTGRVLISENGTYAAGTTGGSNTVASHTHTFAGDALGTHKHNSVTRSSSSVGSTSAFAGGGVTDVANAEVSAVSAGIPSGTISTDGVSGADANMQPYLSVYMWERSA